MPLGDVVAGQPVAVTLVAHPHGIANHGTVVDTRPLTIVATRVGSTTEIRVQAIPDKRATLYRATITFPEAGTWQWSATDGGYVQLSPLPSVTVRAKGSSVSDASGSPAATRVAVVKIEVHDGSFSEPSASIHVGDTIEWTNVGSLSHVVTSRDPGFEAVPVLQPGDTYRTTANTAGEFAIFCPPHPGMVGTLVIEE